MKPIVGLGLKELCILYSTADAIVSFEENLIPSSKVFRN
jgi:hypothetical protein